MAPQKSETLKRPDTVRIFGKTFTVETQPSGRIEHDYNGQVDFSAQVITLASDLHPEKERETVLHELVHGIEMALGLKISEQSVQSLGAGLFVILRENPEWVRWIMDEHG